MISLLTISNLSNELPALISSAQLGICIQRVSHMSHSREIKLKPTAFFWAPSPHLTLVNTGTISQHAETQGYFWLPPLSHSFSCPGVMVSQIHSSSSSSTTYLWGPVPMTSGGCCGIHPHLTWILNANLILLTFILHFSD